MSLAYLTPKGQIIKAIGRDTLSLQNATYDISNIKLDADGQLEEFSINNSEITDLENSYIYVDNTHYLIDEHRKNGKTGYLKKKYFIDLKNNSGGTYYIINNPDTINDVWFDGHFEFAKVGDIFYIEKVIFNTTLDKYYQYLKQSFIIKKDNTVDFSNYLTYPTNNDPNEESPDYNKKEILEVNRLILSNGNFFEEGNFFETNIKKIRQSTLSPDAKKVLYKRITLICFAIYWIRKDILDIVAIKPISEIENAVKNGTLFSQNAQQQYIFSEVDRVIGQLLIDWGYKDYISTKELVPIPNNDNFYGGYNEVFSNYQSALDSFYHNLRVKDEAGLFPDNDSDSRLKVLKDILPSSSWSLLPFSFRRNIIDSYIAENSLKGENETQCLRIIHSFYLVPTEGEEFLDYLLGKRDGSVTNFERLFRLFNDKTISQVSPVVGFFANEKTNRRNFVYAIYEIWKRTKYDFRYIPPNTTPTNDGVNPNAFFLTNAGKNYYKPDDDRKYFTTLEFSITDSSPQFPGNSPGMGTKEIIGVDFYVDDQLQREVVHITKVITHNFFSVNQNGDYIGGMIGDPNTVQDKEQMYLHLYQPINLVDYKPEEDLKDFLPQDPLIPAFVYYYCNEYDRIKDINAAWSLGIDITIEVVFFFISGGASAIKDLRYLHYVTDIGKAFRVQTAAEEAVLILRAAEVGGEVFTLTSSMCWSAAQYIETASNDPQTKETAKKVGRVFFFLTMLGAGATIYARKQATRAAREVLADAHYNSLPQKVKDVVTHLTGAEDVAINSFRTDKLTSKPTIAAAYDNWLPSIKRKFFEDFKNLNEIGLVKLNSNSAFLDNWKILLDKNIGDRVIIDFVTDFKRVNAIQKYYDVTEFKIFLENMTYAKRVKFLDKYPNIDPIAFEAMKTRTNALGFLDDLVIFNRPSKEFFRWEDVIDALKKGLNNDQIGMLSQKNRMLTWIDSRLNYSKKIFVSPLSSAELKSLHQRYASTFTDNEKLMDFLESNRLYTKTKIYKNGQIVEEVTENFISGGRAKAQSIIDGTSVPFVEPSNAEQYEAFCKRAFDHEGAKRYNDTEMKYLFNFFEKHFSKGDVFDIEMESVLYTCTNCQKYLQATQLYAKSTGKTINVKFIAHPDASRIPEVENIIK